MYYRTTITPDECAWITKLQCPPEDFIRFRGDSLKSILNPKEYKSNHQDFYVWLWCWHDFHRDKKFNVPLIAKDDPDTVDNNFSSGWHLGKRYRQFHTWGGYHRQEVVWIYNQIFDTDYELDIVVPGDGPGEPYHDMEIHKWTGKGSDQEPIDYPAIKDHQTAITGNDSFEDEQVKPFKKMFKQYPNGIVFDAGTRSIVNNIMDANLFNPGAQNVWVKLGRKFHSDHKAVAHVRLVALICCILCKIPVNSPYFSLKFQE